MLRAQSTTKDYIWAAEVRKLPTLRFQKEHRLRKLPRGGVERRAHVDCQEPVHTHTTEQPINFGLDGRDRVFPGSQDLHTASSGMGLVEQTLFSSSFFFISLPPPPPSAFR